MTSSLDQLNQGDRVWRCYKASPVSTLAAVFRFRVPTSQTPLSYASVTALSVLFSSVPQAAASVVLLCSTGSCQRCSALFHLKLSALFCSVPSAVVNVVLLCSTCSCQRCSALFHRQLRCSALFHLQLSALFCSIPPEALSVVLLRANCWFAAKGKYCM